MLPRASPDTRTAPQRNADALLEICGLAHAAKDCPTTAGEPPHLTVTIDWDALTGLVVATLDYGTILSASEARRWACDAKIIPSSRAATPNHSTMTSAPCSTAALLDFSTWPPGQRN